MSDHHRPDVVHDDRPWGWFRQYAHNVPCTVKVILVNPGESLSLQRHQHRDELWVVLDDGLEVTVDDDVTTADPGQEFWVPRGSLHRVRGIGEAPARFMEVAFGTFNEADIERLDDRYGRA